MKRKVSRLTLLSNAVAAVVLVASAMVPAVATADPVPYWDWQKASPDSWADFDADTGPMRNGAIKDSVLYKGNLYVGGYGQSGGTLYKYDTSTGAMTDVTPSGLNRSDNFSISTLVVYQDQLQFVTSNNSVGGSEMWTDQGTGEWEQVADFKDVAPDMLEAFASTVWGDRMCVAGRAAEIQIVCYNGDTAEWEDVGAGASSMDETYSDQMELAAAHGKLYVNAISDLGYHGIWSYNGTSWTRLETPFTDEGDAGEETGHNVNSIAADPNGDLVAAESDDYGVMGIWHFSDAGSTWTQLGESNFDNPDNGSYYRAEFTNYQGSLIVAAGAGGMPMGVFEWDAEGSQWSQRNPDYFGADPEAGPVANYAMSIVADSDGLYVSTASEGEGPYNAQVWRTPPLAETPPGDSGDGDNEGNDENGGGGDTDHPADTPTDINGDGINDADQKVVGFVSGFTGKTMALQLSDACDFEVGLKKEDQLAITDSGYDYPENLIRFDADCGTPGFTTIVNQYYYDVDPSDLVARKFNPLTNAYFTIPGATVTKVTINGHTVAKASFTVKDGGPLDVDGLENGRISDPAGLARVAVAAPNTGVRSLQDILFKQ